MKTTILQEVIAKAERLMNEEVNLDIYCKKAIKHRHEALKKLKTNTLSDFIADIMK